MATCVDVAQGVYPTEYNGNIITPTPGKSIIPILRGTQTKGTQETFFWEHFGSNAIRKGDWKLVKLDNNSPWELYDLSKDRTEINNVAEEHPEVVANLKKEWLVEAKVYKALPAPN